MSDLQIVRAGLAAVTGVAVLAVGPVPELGFVLQGFGLGAAVGTLVAYRARRLGFEHDSWTITTRWSLGVALLSALVVPVTAVL